MGVARIADLFSNRVLAELLSILLTHPDEEYHQRQLAAILGRARRPVQVNLKRLEDLNIVTSRVDGNRVSYRCNKESPIFEDLRRIVLKTFGFADVLKEGLSDLEADVELAFIYGSVAKGEDDLLSDIDLLIVGELDTKDAVVALAKLKGVVRREINVNVYSIEEFKNKYVSGNHFINSLVGEGKIYLIGDDERLRAIIE